MAALVLAFLVVLVGELEDCDSPSLEEVSGSLDERGVERSSA